MENRKNKRFEELTENPTLVINLFSKYVKVLEKAGMPEYAKKLDLSLEKIKLLADKSDKQESEFADAVPTIFDINDGKTESEKQEQLLNDFGTLAEDISLIQSPLYDLGFLEEFDTVSYVRNGILQKSDRYKDYMYKFKSEISLKLND
jgi:hypothetical protein